jgi:hypothetical protein
MPGPTLNRVLRVVKNDNGGFLRAVDIKLIAEMDPMRLLLVRCGCGRFLTPAQDVAHFIRIISNEKTDYVRDVSLPTTDPVYKVA